MTSRSHELPPPPGPVDVTPPGQLSTPAAKRGVGHRLRDTPLRVRLVIASVLAVVLALGGVLMVGLYEVRHELRATVDKQLTTAATAAERGIQALPSLNGTTLRPTAPQPGQINAYVQLISSTGEMSTAEQSPVLPISAADKAIAAGDSGAELRRDDWVSGTHVRMVTIGLGNNIALQVALPLTPIDHQVGHLRTIFLLVGLAGLVVAAAIVWFVAGAALRPVRRLTSTAEEIAATRDLTHRISDTRRDELGRLASSFDSMLAALETSVGAQRQLVADASHELRTPLASLRTNVEVLHDLDKLPETMREDVIAGIVAQLEELTALVADVVELARGDEPAVHLEDVSYERIVEHAVGRARRHWPELRFILGSSPVMVRAVPARLDRAVNNLLDNAGKFSPPHGQVDVALFEDGRLTVRDHGPGVPPDALPHVFERFYRSDEARALPGSGLGLAIVAQVAESHGGRVRLGNAVDGGAIAELWLPPLPMPAPLEVPVG
ncbi:MAG: two-component system, OmpR family, sensor histidine kinase MprB [Frankiales bacterium]|jgi:two-component system sensor histidine kinase MprB|nr:two-component system, OmpR family, sensor histidine kinase MprB [Frankiales bacterium]